MKKLSLKELAVPIIKAVDSFNYLLKSHHRRVAVISWHLGKKLGLDDDALLKLVIAAAMHDVGALSVQERDMLVREDVTNPGPHCLMGWRMISTFDAFEDIALILKHHHVHYDEAKTKEDGQVPFQCHIIHLADRVDVLINPDEFILNQRKTVLEKIRANTGKVFHPDVFAAFEEIARADIFWIEINNLDMDQLFRRVNFSLDFELTIENVLDFALMMSRIIDFRSRFTASHSYTVAHLAHLIGGYFGYPEEKRKKLMVAGYLHDLGKIGIDPGLIEKAGPLTDDEYNMVKLHTYYTGQILSGLSASEWFRDIVKWSERHHEKTDGTGYPFSLREDDLDEGVRIIAFSDVISALMEERPYRKSIPVEEAFDIMRKNVAPKISPSIFEIIDARKIEIDACVKSCQKSITGVYETGLKNCG